LLNRRHDGLLFFFDRYDLPAAIFATAWANTVRQGQLTTIGLGTGHQIGGLEGVVRAPAIATPVRNFTFW
jgi:hypothetical protein